MLLSFHLYNASIMHLYNSSIYSDPGQQNVVMVSQNNSS